MAELVLGPVKRVQFFTDTALGNSAQSKGEAMELVLAIYAWLVANGPVLAGAIMGLLSTAELVVRLTPTKKDDTAVERIGKVIRKFFDMLGVPNYKAGGGQHAPASEKEKAA